MPELPEVETMCRGLHPILGGVIEAVIDPCCRYRPIRCEPRMDELHQRLRKKKVQRIHRIGKRVVIEAGPWALLLQPKMSGLVALGDVPTREHIRLELKISGARAKSVLFWDRRGLGTVQLLPIDELDQRIVQGKLGPDALVITADEFMTRLHSTRRPIKVALLDQSLVAGVGNLYASEMLHSSRIDPTLPSHLLNRKQIQSLHAEMLRILHEAIENEGSTLSDGTYRNTLNQDGSYQNSHLVYDRADQRCLSCKRGTIVRIVQSQRSTFYCPICQRPSRRA